MTSPTASRVRACLRLRALRRVLWTERQWALDRTSPDQGLAITSGEVLRILRDNARTAREIADFNASAPVAAMADPIAAADRDLDDDPGWAGLCERFGIPGPERALLALAVARAIDPEFGRVLAYLGDDARQTHATPWLAAMLFHDSPRELALPEGPRSLLKWRLVEPLEGQSPLLPATQFEVDPAALLSIIAGGWDDPRLHGIAAPAAISEAATMPVLHRAALDRMIEASRAGGPLAIDLLGAEGVGRRILAIQFAAARGRSLLVIDSAALIASPPPTPELIIAVLRMAHATGAVMLWRRAELLAPGMIPADLASGLDLLRALPVEAITRPEAIGLVLEKPTLAARLAVWHRLRPDPPPSVVTTQRLTPGEIALVAHAAPDGEAAIRMALRRSAPPEGDVLSRLPCPYGWDDLVAPAGLLAQLRELEAQIRLRWEVYEEWGFSALTHLGTGISALFAGSSGTGKTMAAQILAGALDLDLYRVDLAGVINKYIGETEKRLRDVFAFGERAGTVLFFDEADALFGSRMQAKDSHDRFANIEIDYLLQRIERFDGIAILATNRKSDIDTAFLRRLRFVVDFIPPGSVERLAIWQRALPPRTPSGEVLLQQIDWHFLANRIALTGAEIKSAALSAAFLARGEGSRIGMRHILAATQREVAKRGQVLRMKPSEVTGT